MTDARIDAVINFVREGSRVADIGADHGYLSIELVKSGRAIFVTATEKNLQPLEAARKNISAAGLEKIIDTRHGDGLKILSAGEVDTICIAGMGGALITKILDESPEVVNAARQLILQPMNASEKVRDWLSENDWAVDDEDLAEVAGVIYEIISAVKIPDAVPKKFKRDSSPLLKKFLSQRAEKIQRVLDEMQKSSVARTSEKFSATQQKLAALQNEIAVLNGG
ncbi:MAG: tRNA (adenine(22)-N(1))-methyltransferase TrmK [Selenomonadaceae bacterium]|nr:tRNA (adenine(22)-N(1))-methyltransferase TrmK [Selenomonadaceae bacterium]